MHLIPRSNAQASSLLGSPATQSSLSKSSPSSSGNHSPGPQQTDYQYLQVIANLSPRQLGYPFRRWTISWLNYHLSQERGIHLSDRQVGQMLQQLGISIQAANNSPQDWMPPSSRVVVG